MKVLALGGSGGMGRYAVRHSIKDDAVESLVIADFNEEAATRFAKEMGDKAIPLKLDVQDEAALAKAISESDLVLNTVGPFFKFGVPILRAAIRAKVNYIDINDDWEPTLEMLDLDEEAEKAGITAVIGAGASPGVSNMLAAKAFQELEYVDSVITGWGAGGGGGRRRRSGSAKEESPRPRAPSAVPRSREPSAALIHWMHGCSGKIRIFLDGKYTEVSPVQEIQVDYPGMGGGIAYSVGHPESVTLPRYRKELKESRNVMVGPKIMMEGLRSLGQAIDAGQLTLEQAAQMLMSGESRQSGSQGASSASTDESAFKMPSLPPLFAVAKGTKDGKAKTVGAMTLAMPSGGMGGSTGAPMAVALKMLSRGEITKKGSMAPEGCMDPDIFFGHLAKLCDPPVEGAKQMVMVSTS